MKDTYINNLIDKLMKRSYTVINEGSDNSSKLFYKDMSYDYFISKDGVLYIYINSLVKYNHWHTLFQDVYWLDKAKQIEYLSIRNKLNIDKFIKSIPFKAAL